MAFNDDENTESEELDVQLFDDLNDDKREQSQNQLEKDKSQQYENDASVAVEAESNDNEEEGDNTSQLIPDLPSQRNIISDLLEENKNMEAEGDKIYIIPKYWFDKLKDPVTADPNELGPIDPSLICKDYDNLILADYNKHPYIPLPESVFLKLYEWYGLAQGSQPVVTFLIYDDESNSLIPDYNWYFFRIHHLTQDGASRNYYPKNTKTCFTMTSLATLKDVLIKAMDYFAAIETNIDATQMNFQIWYVDDPSASHTASILSTLYELNPIQFLSFNAITKITTQLMDKQMKEFTPTSFDFVIETKPKQKSSHWPSNFLIYNNLQSSPGTIGLTNLGNTCYMNSALQCITHIPIFRDYFLYGTFQKEVNEGNPLGYQGYMARAFSDLIQSLFGDNITSTTAYSPSYFKSTLGHFNSMFSGYLQQDSQEFLAFLLDSLHEDLNRIDKKPYVEKPSLPLTANLNDFDVVKRLADDTWKAHLLRNDSVITDLFVAMYKSTLKCPECQNTSVTFDPYNDLTLPLPVASIWHTKVKIFPLNSPPCTLEVELAKTSTYLDLKSYISECTGIKIQNLFGCEIFSHQFYTNYETVESNSQFLPLQELISDQDDVIFYEINISNDEIIVPVLNTKVEENFSRPSLFGVPFFITLSASELDNPCLIRYKLEKCYSNLSGGFIPFPSTEQEEFPTLDDFPLLSAKYPKEALEKYTDVLHYSVPICIDNDKQVRNEEYFKIKILNFKQSIKTINNANDGKQSPAFWVPQTHMNFSKAQDITELLNPITRSLYQYHLSSDDEITSEGLVDTAKNERKLMKVQDSDLESPLSEENISVDKDLDTITPEQEQLGIDNEIDLEEIQETDGNSEEKCEEQPAEVSQTTVLNNNLDHTYNRSTLICPGNVIICEWPATNIQKAFTEDKVINWEHPAPLPNPQLEKLKEQRDKQEERHITLDDCLKLFSKPEILSSNDSWYCPHCKEHRQATKQIELWNTPDILLIHLKRFENQRSFSDKIVDTVFFPITDFDISEHLVYKEDPRGNVYDLIAVDNHYGGLGGGHYTAYAKNANDNKWYYFDDSRVSVTAPEKSIAGSAYLLFYVRRNSHENVVETSLQETIKEAREAHQRKILALEERQKIIYEDNKSDMEDYTDGTDSESSQHAIDVTSNKEVFEDNDIVERPRAAMKTESSMSPTTFGKNTEERRSSDYSNESVEVGEQELDDSNPDGINAARKKLRLLKKVYNRSSPSLPLTCSETNDEQTIETPKNDS
ncbi:putative ubiquitin-specific protease UBP12 NDAI_0B00480 [Naumovozyma dairenensis CBS 421]|uniref:ubiquitinyl hydrolase 1 n=1 Tax=Naumovozyma dairenensis (strain ATCC 10597 / BCRC 20456 / CBS 421 / NBRC 0211 / NRRL Y-12639) TaxID=1071378 RepID=G0W5M1_NAUDC|nr:hypothetical protein NDAI_0B00480 [Naumovozyma dairenensis CBS 421]CCD23082.1 hypothetical protein NDAI_0B00480 [Naumovozyma dairenensis CBS 421]